MPSAKEVEEGRLRFGFCVAGRVAKLILLCDYSQAVPLGYRWDMD